MVDNGEKEVNFTTKRKTMHPIPPKCWLESQLINRETNPNPCVYRENIRKEERESKKEHSFWVFWLEMETSTSIGYEVRVGVEV